MRIKKMNEFKRLREDILERYISKGLPIENVLNQDL